MEEVIIGSEHEENIDEEENIELTQILRTSNSDASKVSKAALKKINSFTIDKDWTNLSVDLSSFFKLLQEYFDKIKEASKNSNSEKKSKELSKLKKKIMVRLSTVSNSHFSFFLT